MKLLGRKRILCDEKEITKDNIISVLKKAYYKHCQNAREIQFLIEYERGIQPLVRDKNIRADIDIRTTDNMANYVKEFKIGYFWGSPVLLIQHGDKGMHSTDPNTDDEGITALNEMLRNGNRIGSIDQRLAEFVEIAGIGHKMVDVKTNFEDLENIDTYIENYALDSRYAFCVYHNGIGQKKMLGVTFSKSSSGKLSFTCFSDKYRFEVSGWELSNEIQINPFGMIPIIEFERSVDRTGCFERQISLMDNLNVMVSDFANDVAQKTQEIWWGNDIDFEIDPNTGKYKKPESGQWLLTRSGTNANPKVQPLSSTFDSGNTLQAINNTRNTILQKCKVPMQSESEGGGSTGVAMDISSGWSATEVDAMREQQMIEYGKREELNLILKAISLTDPRILPATSPLRKIKGSDIEFHFSRRRNYDLTVKANFISSLISKGFNGRHVIKAAEAFPDPEQTWADSKEMIEAIQKSIVSQEEITDKRSQADSSDQVENSPLIDGMNTSTTRITV